MGDSGQNSLYDCIIAGAGLAGLRLAQRLVGEGKKVLLLEARSRVGGRIYSEYTEVGTLIEHGAQWVIKGHQRVEDLVSEFNLTPVAPASGDLMVRMALANHRVAVSDKADAELTPFQIADVGQALMKLRRVADRFNNDHAWATANAHWFKGPFTDWLEENIRVPKAKEYLAEVIETTTKLDVSQAEVGDVLAKLATSIDLEDFIAVSGGLSQYRTEEGLFSICEKIQESLGDAVKLSSPIAQIAQDEDQVTVTTEGGETYQGKTLVLAMAPQMVKTLQFTPALPDWRYSWQDKVPVGNVIKAHVVYRRPWWRENGLSGQMGADSGPVRVTFDTSPVDESEGVIMGFFEGSYADSLSGRSETIRRLSFVESLTKAFGTRAKVYAEYYETDWKREPYTRGSHGAHFAPGLWTEQGSSLAEPEGRVFFCGAEYSEEYSGYMEGALVSVEQVADQLAAKLG